MVNTVQHPTPGRDGYLEHPAFGQISAHRISGGKVLFGSDFQHNGFMRIRIAQASLKRDLSYDFVYGPMGGFVEVDLSEAQWAHFVSSANTSGTQCTIHIREGRTMPDLPAPTPRTEQFRGEAAERLERAKQALAELADELRCAGISKAKLASMQSLVRTAQQDIGSNLKFVADSFDKHMERTTTEAQQEIDAHAHRVVQTLGYQALAAAQLPPPVLKLPGQE